MPDVVTRQRSHERHHAPRRLRPVDFALLMVKALENDDLVHDAPAIVSSQAPSALAYA
jgi:hypothetical protein